MAERIESQSPIILGAAISKQTRGQGQEKPVGSQDHDGGAKLIKQALKRQIGKKIHVLAP